MSYLFEGSIENARHGEKKGSVGHYRSEFQKTTSTLLSSHARTRDQPDDFDRAGELVASMGSKTRSGDGPHAVQYVGEWRMVSDNCGLIRGMVSSELQHAYELGLDIRAPEVIGNMFDCAVQVWSEFGEYSGYSQPEGRR